MHTILIATWTPPCKIQDRLYNKLKLPHGYHMDPTWICLGPHSQLFGQKAPDAYESDIQKLIYLNTILGC